MTKHDSSDFDFSGVIIVGLIILGGVGFFIGQVLFYLKDNIWHSISIITALQWFDNKWAQNPETWVGLWNVLEFLPLSLSLIVLGLIIVAVD